MSDFRESMLIRKAARIYGSVCTRFDFYTTIVS